MREDTARCRREAAFERELERPADGEPSAALRASLRHDATGIENGDHRLMAPAVRIGQACAQR